MGISWWYFMATIISRKGEKKLGAGLFSTRDGMGFHK